MMAVLVKSRRDMSTQTGTTLAVQASILTLVLVHLFTAMSPCNALVINDVYFSSSGGSTANVAGTLDAGYSNARDASFAPQLHVVGQIPDCTCT